MSDRNMEQMNKERCLRRGQGKKSDDKARKAPISLPTPLEPGSNLHSLQTRTPRYNRAGSGRDRTEHEYAHKCKATASIRRGRGSNFCSSDFSSEQGREESVQGEREASTSTDRAFELATTCDILVELARSAPRQHERALAFKVVIREVEEALSKVHRQTFEARAEERRRQRATAAAGATQGRRARRRAARALQAAARGLLARQLSRMGRAGAVLLQAAVRGWLVRRVARTAAKRAQAVAAEEERRRLVARVVRRGGWVVENRQRHAAVRLQAVVRGRLARRRVLDAWAAEAGALGPAVTDWIKPYHEPGWLAAAGDRLRQEQGALCLQAAVRRWLAGRLVSRLILSVVRVQAAARGQTVRAARMEAEQAGLLPVAHWRGDSLRGWWPPGMVTTRREWKRYMRATRESGWAEPGETGRTAGELMHYSSSSHAAAERP